MKPRAHLLFVGAAFSIVCLFALGVPLLFSDSPPRMGGDVAWGYMPSAECNGPAPLDETSPAGAEISMDRSSRVWASTSDPGGGFTSVRVSVSQKSGTDTPDAGAEGVQRLDYSVFSCDSDFVCEDVCSATLETGFEYQNDCLPGVFPVTVTSDNGDVDVAWTASPLPAVGETAQLEPSDAKVMLQGNSSIEGDAVASGTVCGVDIETLDGQFASTTCSLSACARVEP